MINTIIQSNLQIQCKHYQISMYIHIYCSITHNSQEMEAAQMSTDRYTDKENVVNIYKGILFSQKRRSWHMLQNG